MEHDNSENLIEHVVVNSTYGRYSSQASKESKESIKSYLDELFINLEKLNLKSSSERKSKLKKDIFIILKFKCVFNHVICTKADLMFQSISVINDRVDYTHEEIEIKIESLRNELDELNEKFLRQVDQLKLKFDK